MPSILRQELECFFAGLSFYTRIPAPAWVSYQPENLNKSRKYLPLIGVLVGFVAALVLGLSSLVLPSSVSILLSIVITVYLTGAFHEDGFADCCDGFGGGWEKAQVLTIMKDSRVGSYGVVGLVLLLGLKFVLLWELFRVDPSSVFISLVLAHAFSRFLASLLMQYYQYVSHIETSKSHEVASLRLSNQAMLMSFSPIVILLLLSLDWRYIITLLFPLFVAFILGQYFKKRIGGYTGDCLGAVQQVTEVCLYLATLVLLS